MYNNCMTQDKRPRMIRISRILLLLLMMTAGATRVWGDPTDITSLSDITDMAGHYRITNNVSGVGHTTIAGPFTGTLEAAIDGTTHMPYKITGLDSPIFSALSGTVKNLVFESINISGHTGNTGAIACTANGAARIYNAGILSGSVGGTGYTGGLVGLLDGTARVINCYSYATITGGTDVGGIVGYNNYETKANDIKTMVMNCMFYGDITGGQSVSPVYGGAIITNLSSNGLNTFNYYAYEKLKSKTIPDDKYNCALAVKEDYLNRFEFYRLLLNSNKKLAAYYITGDAADANIMAKWVLETADKTIDTPKPYPILKAQGNYPSIINYDADHAPTINKDSNNRPIEADRNKGGNLGTLSVSISESNATTGGQTKPEGAHVSTTSLTLTRTDKDFSHFNYNYDKVQLPYYNDVGTNNYTGNKVVTGWKITSMSPVPDSDPYTSANYPSSGIKDYPDHNYADRNSINKDLYSVSGRVFSQGAYFDVPYGVTAITIEPYWGQAAYIADENYDVTYNTTYGDKKNCLGTQATNKSTTFPGLNGQKVYTNVGDALSSLSNSTVYDNAIVLVGNFHLSGVPSGGDKAFTMMSVDWDNDHEPDYSMIYHHSGRTVISPIRFDFLNIPGTAQAQKPKDTGTFLNFTIFKTKGWFETTNTCLVYSNQVEYENKKNVGTKKDSPLILLGGDFEQFVSTQSDPVDGKTIYIHVGGNVRIKSFGLGTHGDGSTSTPHIPVSVTGGEFEGFYLSGTYNQDAAVRTNDNAECYISGGHFVEAAGASQEQIDGSVHWQIYDADMDAFYGGGVNAAKPITGDVTVDIYNSHVGVYCGGPKFGDMQSGKKVTTNAKECTFTKYFGAGFGGTSYSVKKYYDVSNPSSYSWNNWAGKFTTDRGKYFDGVKTNSKEGGSGNDQYGKKGIGVATDVDYEFFAWSSGTTGGRFYVKFASFSLATCNDVESNLKGCTIKENFYGGGSYGEVKGKATSILDGCTVKGNVFGGGYSATLPTVKVRQTPAFIKNPNINKYSGMFEPGDLADYESTEFEWKRASDYSITLSNNNSGSDMSSHYLYTDVDLTALGKVGSTDLTVKDNCQITGSVYGGGDESAVNQNTLVKIQNEGEANAISNVYGGGNVANVLGNAEVNLTSGTISQDVYGGGRGETTIVGGDVTVNIGARTGDAPSFTYTGTGIVNGNVYGGSAYGAVNATKAPSTGVLSHTDGKTTEVNVFAGTVTGSVFGGGLGNVEDGYAATNYGNTMVTIENSNNTKAKIGTALYGGSNVNGVLKGSVTVTITGGIVGTTPTGDNPITNVVFGGGFGEPTFVEGDVEVNIGTSSLATAGATINGHVYGGGALGCVNASKSDSDPIIFNTNKTTHVNLFKGIINGNVYGGGLGKKASIEPAELAVAAYVGGDVTVLLDGAKLNCTYTGEGENRMPLSGQIFGANNLNGTPKGHVKVHVKRTVDSTKNSEITRDNRTTYDVAAVYGGGNQADYIPTDATITLPAPEAEDYAEKLAKKDAACSEVIIEGCDLTSIEYVYGGGNAAAVPATDVTILGSYIIDYVFGGGNGKSTATFTNPGANVGSYNNGATNYGSGKAVTKLVGGHVMYVFGGSNTKGNVRGGTSISMPDASLYPSPEYNCCDKRDIKEIYGAGNEAEQDGAVTMILGCVDNMDYVYGGARNAHVKGGVDLVITSGHFKGVFGGNDTAGSIQGPITLTIEETGCDPLVIDNLYLGGNNAAYSIYGYKNTGTENNPVLVARTKAEYDALTSEQKATEGLPYADPVLNVVSCTSIGNVFGGGLGSTAIMYGSPTVNINLIKGNQAGSNATVQLPKEYETIPNISNVTTVDANTISCKIKDEIGTIGNVYGGGSAASVMGNTHVYICTEENVALRSNMGAPIAVNNRISTPVLGATITGNVFGAGYGIETEVDSTIIIMASGTVGKSIFGGGELGAVNGNTHITVRGGTIGDPTGTNAGETYGNVYGGGKGNTSNVYSGLVKGNTNITIQNTMDGDAVLNSPSIYHNIYGGGAHGSVGTYTYTSEAADATINGYASGGTANITITGGAIGVNGHENGMIFGSSRGEVGAPDGICDKLAWVYNTNVVIGTSGQGTNRTSPHVKGSVYGGGENGHVYQNTSVAIHSGMVGITEELAEDPEGQKGTYYPYRGNVYGAGCGTDKYDNNTKYNPKSGYVGGTASVTIDGGHVVRDVFGAGSMGSVAGSTIVTIAGNAEIGADGSGGGYVFAAARGDSSEPTMATVGGSTLNINGGTVWMDAYGGGQNGAVKGAVAVSMTGGTVKHDVYGGGALANTNTDYNAGSAPANTYTTNITLAGTTIEGNLYGGGLGRLAADAVGTPGDPGYVAAVTDVAADVNGPVTMTVSDGKATNVFGCNNLNGAPKSTVVVTVSGTSEMETGSAINNVYGGGNLAAYAGNPTVYVSGGTVNNVYGGGLGATAVVTGSTSVTISGTSTIANDVYGGGSQADVTGNVSVVVSGGTITNNVYGGGALANTNTTNWDEANTTWATGKTHNSNTTTVTLTGGKIGNVYGGGLGNEVTPVYVYGDVAINVNDTSDIKRYGGTGAAFTREIAQNVTVDGTNYPTVPTTGSIFGANNFNGSPKGNVTVEVFATKRTDEKPHVFGDYEIQGVYGGGNLANYLPADGMETKVIIHGCEDTSIEYVYGGGNSASVPSTDVTIYGAFDIGYAFGGGNGSKPVKNSAGTWVANGGAAVTGNAKISAKGGRIGQVFGGSDAKGDIGGSSTIDTSGSDADRECDLTLTRIFGAGNEADIAGDVNMILSGCGSTDAVQFVHGGSYNAHITGDVNLTITSGFYTNVFGGNDARGSIGGKITVNIEETDACKPIVIHNLVGGGNEAPYPGKKKDGTEYADPGKVTVNIKSATRIDNVYGGGLKADVKGDTEVNINMRKGSMANTALSRPVSYTGDVIPNVHIDNGQTIINDTIGTIGNVYGGGNEGNVIGQTTVNIGTVDSVAILRRTVAGGAFIDAKGDSVYNYQGKLQYDGDVARTVSYEYKHDVLGAHITGSVFGGGNLANVGYLDDDTKENDPNSIYRDTYVNICAKENESTHVYEAVAFGKDDVTIAGNVFGGGNGTANSFKCEKAMVVGNTNVRIGNGTVGGDVYGGGKVGRVEKSTAVTIGLAPQSGSGTSSPVVNGYVFGAGQGVSTHGYSGLARGNSTVIIQENSKVGHSVYGAGKLASLGRYWIATTPADTAAHHVEIGMPYGLKSGGQSTVIIQGNAEIGPNGMSMPTFDGNVFGAGKGVLPYEDIGPEGPGRFYMKDGVYTWESYADDSKEDAYLNYIETLGITNNTIVTIGGNAFVKGSVYGGSENGSLFSGTEVNISGGQIGCGRGKTVAYTSTQWTNENPSDFTECASWTYGQAATAADKYAPYDKYAGTTGYDSKGGRTTGDDGHTFYGNVFGGGCGKDPYKPGKWHRKAGFVGGNTIVNITGGHILTSVYGGNEMTDVGTSDLTAVAGKGKCTVNMTGGTLGVPRTLEDIAAHPVTCYLFGAGKGDQRVLFNTWTNVKETEVNITGSSRIFGSTFGGGEDGHVLENTVTNIGGSVTIGSTPYTHTNVKIGTWGTSYVDGNVFGGGRGFSGEALTAGTVGGNVMVNIANGTMLGSVYGGGRIASVGTYFANPDADIYGQLQEDDDAVYYTAEDEEVIAGTKNVGDVKVAAVYHGHIQVNISGGTIGGGIAGSEADKTAGYYNMNYSGNVYGGNMGRIKLLNGSINPEWPELAQSKFSTVNISGSSHITRNVYGGGEFGIVRENASITIENGTIDGCVYGGGHGSDDYEHPTTIDVHWGGVTRFFTYTPMQWAGCVGGNTTVNIAGGNVKKSVYGGGELASVGVIDYSVEEKTNGEFTYNDKKYSYINIHKHDSQSGDGKILYDYGLSWPYEYTYVPCNLNGFIGGLATVNVTSGTVTEWVYGGGKGQVSFGAKNGTEDDITQQRYTEAFCANVRKTQVTIGTNDGGPSINQSIYGGAENGHVYEDASVTINKGSIAHSVFGGGKGDGKFSTTLLDSSNEGNPKAANDSVYSWTAGKVYGNTFVTMNGGSVGWFIYGGGNMASVGKGNYTGGSDDYAPNGYGELPSANGAIWTEAPAEGTYAYLFQNTGKTTVTILGGTVGSDTAGDDSANGGDGLPYGSIFGGSRGKAAKTVKFSPRYKYGPDFFLGYVNKTAINIGGFIENDVTTVTEGTGPTIHGSVYGGGQDGHVRNSTEVRIFKGEIAGQTGDSSGRSGHVFGAGSGIGKYTDNGQQYCNNASGSVTCTTLVDIKGGTINGNVYGGGALSSVGPPNTGPLNGQGFNELNTLEPYTKRPAGFNTAHGSLSYNKVNIEGGTITGSVYGASRGPGSIMFPSMSSAGTFTGIGTADNEYDPASYATSLWTVVDVKPHPTDATKDPVISGSVYGGGEMGQVKESTEVNLTGGSIALDAYGGGKGTTDTYAIAADVGGNTTVELNKDVASSANGCSLQRIFGCNDLNGTPKGHVTVHVYATQHKDSLAIRNKTPKYDAAPNVISDYDTYLRGLAGTYSINIPAAYTTTLSNGTEKQKNEALDSLRGAISDKKYDMIAVYGGGNLAKYDPTNAYSSNPTLKAAARTEVIIDGCDLTSIKQVYGGGNAAPVPATDLTVNAAYEIDEVFGGGNGKDNYQLSDGYWYENPGANVGYDNYTHYLAAEGDTVGTVYGSGTKADPYRAIVNSNATNKEYRQAYYLYGEGEANTSIVGGRIHYVYGGSNTKGNISVLALSVYENSSDCPVVTDKTYGAGKDAEVDAKTSVSMDCIEWAGKHFGGSTNADVNSDVVLNITNGHYGQVFGGNDTSGKIKGSITVNIQESSCKPIVIGELYGGGYLADYSIYGYNNDNSPRTKAQYESAMSTALVGINQADANAVKEALLAKDLYGYPKHDPCINIISATKIDTIFGGGYKATVVGSPYINVNMQPGVIPAIWLTPDSIPTGMNYSVGSHTKAATESEPAYDYTIKRILANGDAELAIGSIGHIYGGGNLADVNGNTSIDIGTGKWISTWDTSGNPVWETQNASGDIFTYKEKTPAVKYTQEECNTYNATLTGAIASGATLTAEQATAVNTALGLTGGNAYAANGTITTAHANAYNATLVGARNTNDIRIPAVWAWYDANETEVAGGQPANTRNAATITGNVFGGGKGETKESGDGAFKCASAMVGADGDGLIDSNGGTSITIANGFIGGSVYGGGEIGRVEKNTVVTLGFEGNYTDTITVAGNVFGAGKGVATHGYSALVRGNSTVTVQGKTKVRGNVYGGGEIASVGRYNVDPSTGLPTSLKNEKSGNCTVIVRDSAEIGRDNMKMTAAGGPDDYGHVFGAGKGASPYIGVDGQEWDGDPWRVEPGNTKDIFDTTHYGDNKENKYLSYLETLGLATRSDVIISGDAFVKGSVYGGAENGYVQHDTHVTIEGNCQIGNGDGVNRRYTAEEWTQGKLLSGTEEMLTTYAASLPECASWPYESPWATYDKFADEESYNSRGGAVSASNGQTFYGNVFGGGSGYYPYAAGKWHYAAGSVGGNTQVDITGGHILTNVYGGNELTNVEGDVEINFGGTATLGVPRTLSQIAAHPVTCYLFGAGKGDSRVFFNKVTNVQNVAVNIAGGTIYGSVFGGGEDGHVMRDVTMTIGNNDQTGPTIGTWGTSYVDGNIFGGGRGFSGDAYTAGNVAGSVTLNIKGGTMLGSVYGGGRLGSVGYGLYDEGTEGYGEMRDDNKMDDGTTASAGYFPKGRGHVDINITGGTIGNTREYKTYTLNVDKSGKTVAEIDAAKNTALTALKAADSIPNTEFELVDSAQVGETTEYTYTYRLKHTKGGNVFAGGMGRYTKLDGTSPISTYAADSTLTTGSIDWSKLGNVKSTKLTISGDSTWIMGNVYGGGELGAVSGYHTTDGKKYGTEVSITDAIVGVEIRDGQAPQKATIPVPDTYPASGNSTVKYTYGSIYGGGMGMDEHDRSKAENHGGEVKDSTMVTISGSAKVRASVYGAGEMALVGGSTFVNISGGEIGRNEVQAKDGANPGYVKFGGATMGNVYGGGKGSKDHFHTGLVKSNTNVNITGGKIYHMVYGGGAMASVGTVDRSDGAGHPAYIPMPGVPYQWRYTNGDIINPAAPANGRTPTGTATVNITGGIIGISGRDNGLVFGSSRGNLSKPVGSPRPMDPCDNVAWVYKTVVNIGTPKTDPEATDDLTTPLIKGSVYGGGENGHNYSNATVTINSGTIGVPDKDPATKEDEPWWNFNNNDSINKVVRASRGNVYGAGSGEDTYKGADGKRQYNPRAGMVGGSTVINIRGGHIGRSVYGAGAMASVGNITNGNDTLDISRGGTGTAKHKDITIVDGKEVIHGFGLSWPYKFQFAPMTGKTTINVTGGHIGTKDVDGGDVFGGARGKADDRYVSAHLAYVNETTVNIDYPSTPDASVIPTIHDDFTIPCVTGSVSGSGEDGYVYGDTHVTLNKGLVGHSLYGGGKGKGTYQVSLNKIVGEGTYTSDIYSLISGKVFGNTYVTMNDGYVGRNVYGGGNMASVGKGNYASGADDYFPNGYGETLTGNLWDGVSEESQAFLSSGKTTVKVFGGTVGYVDANPANSIKNNLPYGNVFGGSTGEAAPNVPQKLSPRYHYSPSFFSGYVNETDVNIGGYKCKTAYGTGNGAHAVGELITAEEYSKVAVGDTAKWEKVAGPTIYASVYGGGQDGHVRRDTHVTVVSGEIGLAYNSTNHSKLKTSNLDDDQWLHRGNVYGAGSGISKYEFDFDNNKIISGSVTIDGKDYAENDYSTSAGSVTRFTKVDILGGTIHRNVYGGGSLASVGPLKISQTYDPYKKGDELVNAEHSVGKQSFCEVNISGTVGSPVDYRAHYGGEVYGASRGLTTLDENSYSNCVWTKVVVWDGAKIMGNVFGGGDNGMVKKDTDVRIGEMPVVTP